MNTLIVSMLIVMLVPYTLELAGQDLSGHYDCTTSRIDSFFVDEFLVTQQYFPFTGDTIWGGQFKIYRNGKLLVASRIWPYFAIDNEPYGPPPDSFSDLNRDGIKDVTFRYACGGTAAKETTVIYNLDSTAVEIGFFDGLERGIGYASQMNIDIDSIPEIVANDLYYRNHYFYPAGPVLYLLWKWDPSSGRYRLANFKLGDLILRKFHKIDMDTFDLDLTLGERQIHELNELSEDNYPIGLFSMMATFAYCGYSNLADSVFERAMADSVSGKSELYEDIWGKIESAPYWQDLQESNW